MPALTTSLPLEPSGRNLQALIVEPAADQATAPVLLFLHGKGEVGASPNELPLVCVHQTPPFQALLGRLPGALVIAPQALPVPNREDWNWRAHVQGLGAYLAGRFAGRTILATGFSLGGLGVLQLAGAFPRLFARWAVVDPAPWAERAELSALPAAGL